MKFYFVFETYEVLTIMEKLWRTWCVALEMLSDRGFDVSEENPPPTLEKFIEENGDEQSARKNMSRIFTKPSNENIHIMIFWTFQLGVEEIKYFRQQMDENNISHSIIVYGNKITPKAAGMIRQLRVQNVIIEAFNETELQINITKSVKVPRHIICSRVKKDEILKTYNITTSGIPQIKVTDPVMKYYGASRGQLVKIVRPSESVRYITSPDGTKKELFDISYRIVVG